VAAAVAATVNVDVVALTLVGLSVAVTPEGEPVTAAVNATAPVNEPVRATVMVDVADPPCTIDPLNAAPLSVNPPGAGAAVTVSASDAVLSATRAMVRFVPHGQAHWQRASGRSQWHRSRVAGVRTGVTPAGAASTDRSTFAVRPPPRIIVRVSPVLVAPC
jgi:hypothetical protein